MKKQVYFNRKQAEFALIMPNSATVMAGRGSGKTTGISVPWIMRNVIEMPRAMGGIVGKSYAQLLTNILPKFIASLEELGYKEGIHYWVGKRPSNPLVPRSIYEPISFARSITFCNGHCLLLISQDKKSPANGIDLQHLWIDEARLINYPELSDKLLPAVRGLRHLFQGCSGYLGVLYTTDKPRRSEAAWLYEFKGKHNEELKNEVVKLKLLEIELSSKLEATVSDRTIAKLNKQIAAVRDELRAKRSGLNIYFEMATADNLDIIGPEAILKLKEELSDEDFKRSVLNLDDQNMTDSFYSQFDQEKHMIDNDNHDYISNLVASRNLKRDCRWDVFGNTDRPLYIGMDYNANINCMVVGDKYNYRGQDHLNVCNVLFVKAPDTVAEVVDQFIVYYQHRQNKTVHYYYDHTAVQRNAVGTPLVKDVVIKRLQANGWKVIDRSIGKALTHNERYRMFEQILRQEHRELRLSFADANCQQLLVSMASAKAIKKGDLIVKDKSSERRAGKPEDATHLSEALDSLVVGVIKTKGYGQVVDITGSR